MNLPKEVSQETVETVINDTVKLIDWHGYNKCHLLYDTIHYNQHEIHFKNNERESFNIRQLVIELIDEMDIGLQSISEIEGELINHFEEYNL